MKIVKVCNEEGNPFAYAIAPEMSDELVDYLIHYSREWIRDAEITEPFDEYVQNKLNRLGYEVTIIEQLTVRL